LKIKMDLHVHSQHSPDSSLTIKEIIQYYYDHGFNAISITDHNTFEGSLKAKRILKNLGYDLIVLLGAEIETCQGELIVLSLEEMERIPYNCEELIDEVKSLGGLTYAPHPFDPKRRGLREKIYELEGLDAIEVINGRIAKKYNDLALRAARILGKPGLANSDAHTYYDLGKTYTLLEVANISEEAIFKSIKENKIIRYIQN